MEEQILSDWSKLTNKAKAVMATFPHGCLASQFEKKFVNNYGLTIADYQQLGVKSFTEVLRTLRSKGIVDEKNGLYLLCDNTGLSKTTQNIHESVSNRKASSHNKLQNLPGRDSYINRKPMNQLKPDNSRRPVESRFSGPSNKAQPLQNNNPIPLPRSVPNQQNHFYPEPNFHPVQKQVHAMPPQFAPPPPMHHTPAPPFLHQPHHVGVPMMGHPPGLEAPNQGIDFIYERKMIAQLKDSFPVGLTFDQLASRLDLSSISVKVEPKKMKTILLESGSVYYDPVEELYFGRPSIGDGEKSSALLTEKLVYEIIKTLKRSVDLHELSQRLCVVDAGGYKEPRMFIYQSLLESRKIDYHSQDTNVEYFIGEQPDARSVEESIKNVSRALRRMEMTDESLQNSLSSKQMRSRMDFVEREWTDAMVSDLRDLSCFSVRLLQNMEEFRMMGEELIKYCDKMSEKETECCHLMIGEMVGMKREGEWIRVEVLYGGDSKMVILRAIDIGYCFYETLPSRNVIFLPEHLKTGGFSFYCSVKTDGCDKDELVYYEEQVKNSETVSVLMTNRLVENSYVVKLRLRLDGVEKVLPDAFVSVHMC